MHQTAGLTGQGAAPTAKYDRTRWKALVVLCIGMLMIVLTPPW
jgi:hypothetical protein